MPPINVLIVEDNIINLKLLEAFCRRLKVRWSTAVNGQIALNKWRQGGFHLVLMDLQMPVMSGLEATKEIRRLERVNGIGAFIGKQGADASQENPEKDILPNRELFKSPVIIVALTASNLQSDRHEALALGSNDFLTKVSAIQNTKPVVIHSAPRKLITRSLSTISGSSASSWNGAACRP